MGKVLLRILALLITPTALATAMLVEWAVSGGKAMTSDAGMAWGLVILLLIPAFAIATLTIPLWMWLLRAAPLSRLLAFSGVALLSYVVSTGLLGLLIFAGLWPRHGGLADRLAFYVLPFAPILPALGLGYLVARRPVTVRDTPA